MQYGRGPKYVYLKHIMTARLRRLAGGRRAREAEQGLIVQRLFQRSSGSSVHADISADTGRYEGLRYTGQPPHASIWRFLESICKYI